MNETLPPPLTGSLIPKTSALAVWSLVLGILAIALLVVCLGPIFAIPAIICGHMACSKIKHSGGQLTGAGLATAGFITGYVSLGLVLLMIPIAIPNLVKARATAQKNICINNLRMIDAAKNQWAMDNKKQGSDMPTESEIVPYLKNHEMPKCPVSGVYKINPAAELPTCSIPGHTLTESANP